MSSINKVQVDGVVYDLGGSGGFSDNAKNALLDCLSHIAWVDENGQQYVDALQTALFADTWSVTNSLTNAVTSNPSATVVKDGSYSATISASVGYTLTGATVSVTMNGADITATAYNNGAISIPTVTGAVVITVVAVALTVVSISAVYTQSGTVYDTDSLDDLKADLVVTATMSDSSTVVVPSTDYTLSGSLTAGTSTITVSALGETTTFSVTVTHNDILYALPSAFTSNGTNYIDTGVAFALSHQYSLCITFSITQFSQNNDASGTNTGAIFGDTHGASSSYTALAERQNLGGSGAGRYCWGCNFGFDASKNFVNVNQTIKFLFTFDVGSSTYTRKWYIKNVTAGTSNNGTGTNTTANIKGYNVFLGKQETSAGLHGFDGTITDFKIYDRLLTDDEISAYMG